MFRSRHWCSAEFHWDRSALKQPLCRPFCVLWGFLQSYCFTAEAKQFNFGSFRLDNFFSSQSEYTSNCFQVFCPEENLTQDLWNSVRMTIMFLVVFLSNVLFSQLLSLARWPAHWKSSGSAKLLSFENSVGLWATGNLEWRIFCSYIWSVLRRQYLDKCHPVPIVHKLHKFSPIFQVYDHVEKSHRFFFQNLFPDVINFILQPRDCSMWKKKNIS